MSSKNCKSFMTWNLYKQKSKEYFTESYKLLDQCKFNYFCTKNCLQIILKLLRVALRDLIKLL